MSSPGWTPMPNWLMDSMSGFDPLQFKILVFVARQLYGFEQPDDNFGVRRIAKGTGIPRSTVQYHLARMIAAGHLVDLGKGRAGARRLGFREARPIRLADLAPANPQDQDAASRTVPDPGQESARSPGHQKRNSTDNLYVQKPLNDPLAFLKSRLPESTYRDLSRSVRIGEDGRLEESGPMPVHLRSLLRALLGSREPLPRMGP